MTGLAGSAGDAGRIASYIYISTPAYVFAIPGIPTGDVPASSAPLKGKKRKKKKRDVLGVVRDLPRLLLFPNFIPALN